VIKNIPPNVLLDQFGILGLAIMINHRDDQSQYDEDVSVMIGKGQTSFRFLQKSQTLFQNKNESVLSNQNKSPNECSSNDDSDLNNSILAPFQNASLLDDYKISSSRLKLIDPNELLHTHFNEDLLFYLFYMCCQDELQHKAYTILCAKNWIYNKELKVWFKPVNTGPANINQQAYDLNSSQYFVFDVNAWEIKLVNSSSKSKFKSASEQSGEF
jgi:CCR4-NOT transcriptional regulation complex NOT5 subunit